MEEEDTQKRVTCSNCGNEATLFTNKKPGEEVTWTCSSCGEVNTETL